MVFLILFIVMLTAFAVIAPIGATRQFQMLQQNSYFASRYYRWLKSEKQFFSWFQLLFLALFVWWGYDMNLPSLYSELDTINAETGIWDYILATALGILVTLICAAAAKAHVTQNRKSIKPLVFTARVKRMYFAAYVISFLFAACAFIPNQIVSTVALGLLFAFLRVPWLLTFLVLFITKPIEKLIARRYLNDAKRILKQSSSLTTVGVTGSYGKTGTKFILKGLLEEDFNVTATPGSFNTPMGVVRTVREHLRPETDIFICEMGAKRKGDIKEICDIAKPQIGVITSVGPQHLDTFGSIETVADTKFELADAAHEVFLNYDNEIIRSRGGAYNTTSYGTTPDCDVYADNISYGSFGAEFEVVCDGTRLPLRTRLLGRHNVLNITAGVAVAKRLGLSDKAITYAVSRLAPTEHRLELKSFINGSLLIDDAYNANPEGCLEAVNVLSSFENKKKFIVTPGLIELGDKEYECNYNLGLAAAQKCDIIILVGQQRSVPMRDAIKTTDFNEENLFVVSSFAEAMEKLRSIVDNTCVTLFENDLPDNYLK